MTIQLFETPLEPGLCLWPAEASEEIEQEPLGPVLTEVLRRRVVAAFTLLHPEYDELLLDVEGSEILVTGVVVDPLTGEMHGHRTIGSVAL